jgi:acetyltransferase-like isoleucine patch superfamily enzyme
VLKSVAKSLLRRAGLLPDTGAASWARYREYVRIDPTAIIDPAANIKIFNPPDPPQICLEIGARSHVFASFSLLRPQARIRIGARCQLGVSTFVCADSIDVGDDVLMAWGITLMDNDSHALTWEGRKNDVMRAYEDYRLDAGNLIRNKDWSAVATKRIRVGDRSWIGFGASILKGVNVGAEAVVGAASVVTRDVPDGCVVAGNPARVVGGASNE